MAQINVRITATGIAYPMQVDLKRFSPIHVMFQMAHQNHAPAGGNIWKMTKTGRALSPDDHFTSLEHNGITDGADVELVEFPI